MSGTTFGRVWMQRAAAIHYEGTTARPPAYVCTCDVHETYPVVPDEVLVLFGKWIGQPLGIHCRLSSAVLCLLLLLLAPSRLASTTHGK